METKFTQGPWSVVEDDGDHMVYAEPPREGVELCIASDINGLRHRRADGSWDKSQVSANAHLIAAAPELYEAAAAAVAYDDAIRSCANDPDRMASFCTAAGDDLDSLYADWIFKSSAALAKARGE